MKSIPLATLTATSVLLISQGASAALYSTTKVEALYGWDYEDRADAGFGIDNQRHAIFTIANASGWTYGDSYFFADFTNVDRDTEDEQDYGSTHAEWNLRGNIGKVLGRDLSFGPVTNLYLSGQLDFDRNSAVRKTTHMVGLGYDIEVPGFAFFKVFTMYRDDDSDAADGTSEQLTLAWNSPFTIGDAKFSFEGFLDYTTEEGDLEEQLLTQPQLMWHANDHIALGLEYQYWHNKFGLDGTDESLPQAIVRWTF
ncbi:outer membrane protein OmpK [Halomonas sp. V046]|uniref:outer membrane protein OmpK n=1 Tax=Halomonas sp. V046 TaxID=3459611 RepID=UPI0040450B6C